MGSEFSLKTAVVSLFVEGVLEIEGDEKGEGMEGEGRGVGGRERGRERERWKGVVMHMLWLRTLTYLRIYTPLIALLPLPLVLLVLLVPCYIHC